MAINSIQEYISLYGKTPEENGYEGLGVSPMMAPYFTRDEIKIVFKDDPTFNIDGTIYQLDIAYRKYQFANKINIEKDSKFRDVLYQWRHRSEPDKAVMIFIPFLNENGNTSIKQHIVSSDGRTYIPDFLNDYI